MMQLAGRFTPVPTAVKTGSQVPAANGSATKPKKTTTKKKPSVRSTAVPGGAVASCTSGIVDVPSGIAFVKAGPHQKVCLHARAEDKKTNFSLYSFSESQFKDVKLNITTLKPEDTMKPATSDFFVCGLQKTVGNSRDVWVLTKGDSAHQWGWINSQALAETDPVTGYTKGLTNCLALK